MPHIAIIGAGVSGLAAGVLLRKAGLEVDIYERDRAAGGLAACWNRRGYHMEGAIHWMIGCFPGSLTYPLWQETGALQSNNIPDREDPPLTLIRPNREPLCWYRDLTKTEAHLLANAPEDANAIRQLIHDVTLYRGLSQLHRGISFGAILRAWPLIRMSAADYAAQFSNPDLRALIGSVITPYHNAFSMMYVLGAFAVGEGGYPKGGGAQLVQNMVDTFQQAGGRLHLQSEVEQVVVEKGRARGVMVGGQLQKADAVLVASDARQAVDSLFKQPITNWWAKQVRTRTQPNEVMLIALGVKADLRHLPHTLRFRLFEPLEAGGLQYDMLPVYNYAHMPGYAPDGCTTLTVLLFGPTYSYWKQAREDGSYTEKKRLLAEAVIRRLATFIPETDGKIEMTDVTTPLTYERYCATFEGSLMNVWKAGKWPLLLPTRLPGMKGVYFTGQRTLISGGLPIALLSANRAAKTIIKYCK